jgi:hypothetical protein
VGIAGLHPGVMRLLAIGLDLDGLHCKHFLLDNFVGDGASSIFTSRHSKSSLSIPFLERDVLPRMLAFLSGATDVFWQREFPIKDLCRREIHTTETGSFLVSIEFSFDFREYSRPLNFREYSLGP